MKLKWIRPGILNLRLKSVKLVGFKRLSLPKIKFGPKAPKKISGNASHIRYLIMILPLAISDLIRDKSDPVWQMVLQLRKICDLVCSPALSHAQVDLVAEEIIDYIHLRKTCFPKNPPKPKHGYIQRYSYLIRKFGPLKHLWTLRFESKHKPFKEMIKFLRNFKDVTGTLAEKHELLQSALENQYHDNVEPVNPVDFSMEELEKTIKYLPVNGIPDEPDVTLMCQDVVFRGIRYAKDMSVCVGKDDCDNLILCKIRTILVNERSTTISFIGQTNSVKYNAQVGYYQDVEDIQRNVTFWYPYSSLLSPDPIIQSYAESMKVFVTKYAPYDKDP
ncbi:hypothetical protein QAD02_017586 [Eretmocerus hayati]|uniref:Uncharacterized protein n=1 Tax=Eretmocerus hayati TaxID=131215 RepID=A0ACC2PER0_9HYME|nr:hypothetical protein QAD02_017586 [Eretmocerus hayati]